ncbi:MAG: hypothetical protein IKK70_05990 [Clostridia bacterium]|nr:hypothetical protein [Clostridia bacterium]
MKSKTFYRILFAIVTIGVLLTISHTVYAIIAYDNTSIIHFVSREWW